MRDQFLKQTGLYLVVIANMVALYAPGLNLLGVVGLLFDNGKKGG